MEWCKRSLVIDRDDRSPPCSFAMLQIIQVCAYELDIPVSLVGVRASDSMVNANSSSTGGSVTSELCSLVGKRYLTLSPVMLLSIVTWDSIRFCSVK